MQVIVYDKQPRKEKDPKGGLTTKYSMGIQRVINVADGLPLSEIQSMVKYLEPQSKDFKVER